VITGGGCSDADAATAKVDARLQKPVELRKLFAMLRFAAAARAQGLSPAPETVTFETLQQQPLPVQLSPCRACSDTSDSSSNVSNSNSNSSGSSGSGAALCKQVDVELGVLQRELSTSSPYFCADFSRPRLLTASSGCGASLVRGRGNSAAVATAAAAAAAAAVSEAHTQRSYTTAM
jgi:hypothetical protein